MLINFRQGIIKYPAAAGVGQQFLQASASPFNSNIDLITSDGPTIVAFAHKTSDYSFSESNDVTPAWTGVPTSGNSWLYWELNPVTAIRTFGFTLVQPVSGPTAPTSPALDQHWFDTANTVMKVWDGVRFVEKIRVFAARHNAGQFFPLGIGPTGTGSNPFAGTQVGLRHRAFAGSVLFDVTGMPVTRLTGPVQLTLDGGSPVITNLDGTFFTTESEFFANASRVNAIRLESDAIVAQAQVNLPAYHVVQWNGSNVVGLGHYNSVGNTAFGIVVESALINEQVTVVAQGVITNEQWNWPTIGATLWVSTNGQLVDEDPYVTNLSLFPVRKPPVARVIGTRQIIFQQGLGMKGDQGPSGSAGLASDADLGSVYLSVAPAVASLPTAVGVNDPDFLNALKNVVEDLTPQLGGDLDVNGFDIISASDITLTSGGSPNRVIIDGLSYPNNDGVAGYVLTTDGTGKLSFQSAASATTLAGLGDTNIGSPANNNVLAYNSVQSRWIPRSAAEAGLVPDSRIITSALGSGLLVNGSEGGTATLNATITLNVDPLEHTNHATVSMLAGDGLSGGGTIQANRTFDVNTGDGIQIVADAVAVDDTVVRTTQAINAGAGLTGGGLLGSPITIALSASSLASLALADTALQENNINAGVGISVGGSPFTITNTITTLNDLTDVVIGSPITANNPLVFNGTNWENFPQLSIYGLGSPIAGVVIEANATVPGGVVLMGAAATVTDTTQNSFVSTGPTGIVLGTSGDVLIDAGSDITIDSPTNIFLDGSVTLLGELRAGGSPEVGVAGYVLTSNGPGVQPSWEPASGGSSTFPLESLTNVEAGSPVTGDILYFNQVANEWLRLPRGTDGQVLTVFGSPQVPSWQTASGGAAVGSPGEIQLKGPGTSFTSDSHLHWNSTTNTMTVGGGGTNGSIRAPITRALTLASGQGSTSAGGAFTITTGSGAGGTFNGGTFTLLTGSGNTNGNGGPINLTTGNGGNTAGTGGDFNVTTGLGVNGGFGGSVLFTTGDSNQQVGGNFTINLGSSGASAGGAFSLTAGAGLAGIAGGAVTIRAGSGGTTGAGGHITLRGGETPSGTPGTIIFQTGATSTTRFTISSVLTAAVPFRGADGSNTAPTYSFTSDTDTGIFLNATGELAFTTAGTTRFIIEGDGSWNINGSNGSSGQVLTSNGAGSTPTWQTSAAISEPLNQIVYGTGSGVDSEADFTWTPASNTLSIGNLVGSPAAVIRTPISINGSELHILAGDQNDPGNTSQAIFIRGGESTISNGNGGGATFRAGDGLGAARSGGSLTVRAGAGTTIAGGGTATFAGGNAVTGTAGSTTVRAGNATGAGTGGNLTLAGGTTVGGTAGSVIFQTAGTARLTVEPDGSWNINGSNGSTGQVLTSNGAGSTPTWQNVASGSAPVAGAGLTLTGSPQTYDVGAGDGITVNANDVAVDATVVRTTGTQSIAGVKTFTDIVYITGSPAILEFSSPVGEISAVGDLEIYAGDILVSGTTVTLDGSVTLTNELRVGGSPEAGVVGQVLTSQGAGVQPIWADASGGASTLPELTDVLAGSPVTGSLLFYRGSPQMWDATTNITFDDVNSELTIGGGSPNFTIDVDTQVTISTPLPLVLESGSPSTIQLAIDGDVVQTTSGSPVALHTIALATDTQRVVVARVRGFEPATDDTYWSVLRFGAKNVGGTASIVGSSAQDVGYDAGAAAWVVDADASGANARIVVTGETGKTINWTTTTEIS